MCKPEQGFYQSLIEARELMDKQPVPIQGRMLGELMCSCGRDLVCIAGASAHRTNWYCEVCDP